MIAFRDRKRRLWTARLDVAAAVRMRDLAGVDVMALALGSQEEAVKLASDPPRLANALFALCLPLCEARGISDREFGRSLRGRFWGHWLAPAALAEMVFEAVRDFFEVPELSPGKPKGKRGGKATAAGLWGDLWRLASIVGADPDRRTFGELIALADGRQKFEWGRTACVLAMLYNTRAFGGGKAKQPAEFDPTGGLGTAASKSELKVDKTTLRDVALIFSRAGRG